MASYKKFSVKGKKCERNISEKKEQNIFLATIYRFLESFPPFCNSIFIFKQIYILPSCLLRHLVQQKVSTDTYFS